MPAKTKKTVTDTVAPVPATESVAPTTEVAVTETDDFTTVVETLEAVQKQVKALIVTVKTLKKENDKLKKLTARKGGKKAASTTPRQPSGFAKPSLLSDELCDFLGVAKGSSMSRTDVTAKVNEYIKKNNLRNEKDKRQILPDGKLNKILNLSKDDKLTYFNLQRFMKHHYQKVE